ncbi:MAG: hypothetical protein MUC65_10825 [Pontiellaceae bacterium]|nr:hypothetical protein [Pontiellaceae bacterium]
MKKVLLSSALCILIGGLVSETQAAIIANVRTTNSTTVSIAEDVADFIVYDSTGSGTTVRKNGGPGIFSAIGADGIVYDGGYGSTPVTLQWSNGNPTDSGSSYYCKYAGFGSSFADPATYMEMQLTMPSTSGTLTLWTYPNGNTGSLSYDITFGKTGDQWTETSTLENIGKIYEFQLSGFTVGDTLTFRVDNVSGSNSWHNFGIYGAQFVIPEPVTALSFVFGGILLAGYRRLFTK